MAVKVRAINDISGIELDEYYVAKIAENSYSVMHLRALNDPQPVGGGHTSEQAALHAAETLNAVARPAGGPL